MTLQWGTIRKTKVEIYCAHINNFRYIYPFCICNIVSDRNLLTTVVIGIKTLCQKTSNYIPLYSFFFRNRIWKIHTFSMGRRRCIFHFYKSSNNSWWIDQNQQSSNGNRSLGIRKVGYHSTYRTKISGTGMESKTRLLIQGNSWYL